MWQQVGSCDVAGEPVVRTPQRPAAVLSTPFLLALFRRALRSDGIVEGRNAGRRRLSMAPPGRRRAGRGGRVDRGGGKLRIRPCPRKCQHGEKWCDRNRANQPPSLFPAATVGEIA